MNRTMKLVLGTCLLGFVNLVGMEVDGDAKKVDGTLATGALPHRRSADSNFVVAKGSIKGVSDDVVIAHGEAIGKYQAILEDEHEALRMFEKLDQKQVQAIIKARDALYKRLDTLKQNEFVLAVKGLHEAAFKAGNVERLVMHDEGIRDTSKRIPLSHGLVVLWSDEFFIIEKLRIMAASMEAGTRLSTLAEGQGDAKESCEIIRNRVDCCNFVDSSDGKVMHTKFPEAVEKLLGLIETFVSQSADDGDSLEALAEQLHDGANTLARTYLVPVL